LRHFEAELDNLRKLLLEMSGLVESAIYRSVQALVGRDEQQARQVLENESRINRMEIEIDDLATRLLALEQPVAIDLRFITAASKINNDLERMGDLAVNIAERSIALVREPAVKPPIDIPHMAMLVESMVRNALDAFVRKEAALARSVLVSDDAVDELRDRIVTELTIFLQQNPTTAKQSVPLLFVAQDLERIADHATNIAEDVLFVVEGIDVRHHAEARK
jgi:phosphate transport system protein